MSQPRVSLLVAMRNEVRYIQRCLDSLIAQDYPFGCLEIWVMDGQSTDGSQQIVERILRDSSNAHLISNPGITQAKGWNIGIESATGQIIGIVSAHSELATDYVSKAVETLQRTGADMVGGPMHGDSPTRVGQAIALATSSRFGVGGARFHYTTREEPVDTVYMGVCWKDLYQRIGGFDEAMVNNQDDELSYRILKQGGRIICNPAIRSRYYNRATLRSLWRQYFQYGYWKVGVMHRHPHQIRPRHFAPPTFVASLLCLASLALFTTIGAILLGSVGGAYVLVNLTASARTAYKGGSRHMALLPLTFPVLHLSYGLGFLTGVLDFLVRGRKSAMGATNVPVFR